MFAQRAAIIGNISKILLLIVCGAIAVKVIYSFVGLGVSSYWIDELYTMFVVDRPDLASVLAGAATDFHPPGFYIAAYWWRLLAGEGEADMRLFGALCCVGSLPIIYAAARQGMGVVSALFVVLLQLSSIYWFEHSQNIRSNGIAMLLTSAMAWQSFRILHRDPDRPVSVDLGIFFAIGLLNSVVHNYGFLITGLCYGYLILAQKRLSRRIALVALGTVTAALITTLLFSMTKAGHADAGNTWFSNSPAFLIAELKDGLRSLVQKGAIVSLLIAALAATACVIKGRAQGDAATGMMGRLSTLRSDFLMSAWVCAGLLCTGILVSIFVAPSFSGRNFGLCAPFFWLMLGHIFAFLTNRVPEQYRTLVACGSMLPIVVTTFDAGQRLHPWREEYRGSAHYVAGFADCAGQTVPVVLSRRQAGTEGGAWLHAYRHYLADRPTIELESIGFENGVLDAGTLGPMLARRSAGTDRCPVLGWAVHTMGLDVAEAARHMRQLPGFDPAATIRIVGFQHNNVRAQFRPMVDAFVIVVTPAQAGGGSGRGG